MARAYIFLLFVVMFCQTYKYKEKINELEQAKEQSKVILENSNIKNKEVVIQYIDKSFKTIKNLTENLEEIEIKHSECKDDLAKCNKEVVFGKFKWFFYGMLIGSIMYASLPVLLRIIRRLVL